MFGYVCPVSEHLDWKDMARYQAVYCGLCHTLGRRYGLIARCFLNYDMVFLAMLFGKTCESNTKRCVLHPVRGRPCACRSEPLDMAADISVILVWWQMQDGIADHGFWRGLKYRLAAMFLGRAYRKARANNPAINEITRSQMEKLWHLEKQRCDSFDRSADCFAGLLAGISAVEHDPKRRRILSQFLYHLGRWIYIVDALDDLKKDLRSGNYNPLAICLPVTATGILPEESRLIMGQTLDASIRQMAAAFELTEFGDYTPMIQNVVYEGLYLVGNAVMNGTFRRRSPQKLLGRLTGKAGSAHA